MFGKNVEVGYKYVVRQRVGNDWSHDGLINLENNNVLWRHFISNSTGTFSSQKLVDEHEMITALHAFCECPL